MAPFPGPLIDGLLKTLYASKEPQVASSLFAIFELILDAPNSLFLKSIDTKFGYDHDIDAKHLILCIPTCSKGGN
jgi:hypothetical protein